MPRYTHYVLAFGFWLWCVAITVGAGYLGALLNCEGGEGCKEGEPSWLQPWTWGDYYVYPDATIVALIALVPASTFLGFVLVGRLSGAVVALVLTLVLLSYAYFAGLTPAGRVTFAFGPLLGVGAIWILRRLRALGVSV